MKINVNKVSSEGLSFEELISSDELDLNTDIVRIKRPVKISAFATKISNALSVDMSIDLEMQLNCSRCLKEYTRGYNKKTKLNFRVEKPDQVIDLNPDIREEIILDYQMNPLCKQDCKGLCPKCGKDLNEGGCSCGTT